MADKIILYTNVNQQIQNLKSQNLIIENEDAAKEALLQFGYSNLIKSYREPYTYYAENQKSFRSGVTFTQICSLYLLDKNLRNAVMAAMLDLEEVVKEAAADVVASSFGVHQDDYLKYRNFQNKRKHKYRFSLAGILDKMKETLESEKDPIHHYRTQHGIVPPWILFKSVYFSTIINYIDQFKHDELLSLVSHLYNADKLNIPEESLIPIMMDTLFACYNYRNVAAHGGRIYNYVCDRVFHPSEYIQHSGQGFSHLLYLLSLLRYQLPYQRLSNALTKEINRHCKLFPSDVTYLGQTLNINIEVTENVYVSRKSKKFHTDSHCSGMQNSQKITLSEAESQGYSPCKRCCN